MDSGFILGGISQQVRHLQVMRKSCLFMSVTSVQGKSLQGGIYEWLRCEYVKHHSRVDHEN